MSLSQMVHDRKNYDELKETNRELAEMLSAMLDLWRDDNCDMKALNELFNETELLIDKVKEG